MTGYYFEDLQIGQSASVGKTITEADILLYAAVSTDTNPIHIDADAAKSSLFGERIAHGMLSAGLISAVLGTRLPGPGSLYMRQSLRFAAPVKIGDTVKVGDTQLRLQVGDLPLDVALAQTAGVKKTGKGRRKLGRKKRKMRSKIRHRK